MILEKLCEFAETVEDFPPPHFKKRSIDYLIEINEEGELLGFTDVSDEGKIFIYADHLIGRTSQVKPHLLVDKASYVFGNIEEESLSSRQKKTKNEFYKLILESYQATNEQIIYSILKFLENTQVEDYIENDLKNNNWLAFKVNGKDPLKIDSIQEFWQKRQNKVANEKRSDFISECLICGQEKVIADRDPEQFKLLRVGGQSGGSSLISANHKSFESYGLSGSYIASICFDCATQYGRAANYLIAKEDHRLKIGDILYIFWTKNNLEFNGFELLENPEENELRDFLNSFRSGKKSYIDDEEFYCLALSANNSRTVVRDWISTTIKNVEENINNYFREMKLDDNKSDRYYGINSLVSQTAFKFDDIKPIVAESLASYAIKGNSLVEAVLFNTVKRIKADVEFRVTRPRASLLKMYFNSHPEGGIKVKEKLNKKENNPAYLCGRLFSVIEIIQKKALPGIKSTIVDRYYGTASSAPASVFGNLIRKAQHHLAKLRKEESTTGMYYWLQSELEDIMVELNDFPATLSLKEQGLFALGYYQQKAYRPEKDKEGEN
ncbi:CRISPR-associated protein, Csd1 family [Halanaerobium congolense]|uniref:CRISPR-associated protein, Csd1 family n=1 Tax=Halanaerobium congolense TaxID=54121 RepID=A0A1H9Z3A8_9FIRM|nr:type I-C CRISPR-associated protein Cas8c/Csd1 [Halanaerobium congolense]PTX17582.1 CRISPR-associated Csd1 family protein [Halanaerobium congolense]SDE95141.1 CRISPR-associated protein, Csd1 family [Halanaerobium congolense]SES75363.1 CRISPR-associated protein, Csd1 family [Halanaerobium congolense]SFP07474.1 CRISPR-associated protein, Csd1 family [Halanaerobium congolense]